MDTSKMKNLFDIIQNVEGDSVICTWCEWRGLVPYTAECCPNCGQSGHLMFIDENKEGEVGTVYIPKRNSLQ